MDENWTIIQPVPDSNGPSLINRLWPLFREGYIIGSYLYHFAPVLTILHTGGLTIAGVITHLIRCDFKNCHWLIHVRTTEQTKIYRICHQVEN